MCFVIIGLTKSGRAAWQRGGGHKKIFQYCADSSGTILYLRALQGHSGRNLIDPFLQDSVTVPDGFFKYICHVGCAINLHSFINSGLIPGCENLSNRQTGFLLPVDPMDKNRKDPDTIDLEAPRLAQYMHKASKKHQNTENWIDINFALKKGLKFYQTRSNAIILHETLAAYCIPNVVRMETGGVIFEKENASLGPPPKISLKHDWMKELGSEHAQRPQGQVVRQAKSSQPSQPNPNPYHDRTGKPVVCRDTSHAQGASQTRSSHESTNFNVEDETNHDRTGKPVVCSDTSDEQGHEQSMLNAVDIDFRIPGLPHSVVKQAENCRVRELVKKIENHPHHNLFNEIYNKTKPTTRSVRGIVHCTCGHLLKESAANRGVIQYTLNLLSIPECIIKKGRPHGHRCGKTPEKKEYHLVHNLKKRCIKKHFKGIHDRFLKDPEFRTAMLEHDRDGNTGPLRNRYDFNEALSTLNRLHQESGER